MDKQVSEFNEPRWAVLSERGVEMTGVAYAEAAAALKRLRAERVRGLCIITQEAAQRFTGDEQEPAHLPPLKTAT